MARVVANCGCFLLRSRSVIAKSYFLLKLEHVVVMAMLWRILCNFNLAIMLHCKPLHHNDYSVAPLYRPSSIICDCMIDRITEQLCNYNAGAPE